MWAVDKIVGKAVEREGVGGEKTVQQRRYCLLKEKIDIAHEPAEQPEENKSGAGGENKKLSRQ